jgi:voltage-gated sodium channel
MENQLSAERWEEDQSLEAVQHERVMEELRLLNHKLAEVQAALPQLSEPDRTGETAGAAPASPDEPQPTREDRADSDRQPEPAA